jgi:hypothetical protein
MTQQLSFFNKIQLRERPTETGFVCAHSYCGQHKLWITDKEYYELIGKYSAMHDGLGYFSKHNLISPECKLTDKVKVVETGPDYVIILRLSM